MSGKIRASILSLTIITVLIFSAVGPTIVYADGSAPPDVPPTETGGECTSDGADSSACLAEEPAPEVAGTPDQAVPEVNTEATSAPETTTDPAASTGEAPAEVVTSEEAATPATTEEAAPVTEEAAPAPDASILNEVPADTTVIVLDANGQSQPLATQAAADAVATSDPIWCPATQAAPTPGANGCTASFTSFDALLTTLATNPTLYVGAGTIYVEQGAYQGSGPIDFNTYTLSNISGADLTITGGWNTTTGAIDSATPSTFTNTSIIIGGPGTSMWGGSLTINNISMNFSNPVSTPPAIPVNGLTLYSQSNITLSNVSVTNAPSAGADLNAGGDVNVNNSKFDRNQTAGATIKAGKNVSIANSSFSNPANGRRQDRGLDIVSGLGTSLFNVLANNNRQAGTTIVAGGPVTIGSSFFSGTKLMNGAGTQFAGYGLQVETLDTIAIDSVTANDNFLWGASLKATGDIAISNSIFNANTTASPGFIDDTGLIVDGGANVALNNVTANDNRLFGAIINSTGTVSINNSTFNNNRGVITTGGTTSYNGHGLKVTSLADIFLNNVTANNNMLFGAQLNAGGEVAIANSTFSNTSTGVAATVLGKGLDIVSTGNASLLNVVLDNNQTSGATIQAGGDIFLDTVTATNNGSNGVEVVQGNCTYLTGGIYSGNLQYGLNLGPSALTQSGAPAFSGNGAGDIFPATPPACVIAASVPLGAPTSGAPASGNIVGVSYVSTSLQASSPNSSAPIIPLTGSSVPVPAASIGNVTLNNFLATAKTAHGGVLGIFTGKYAYVYSSLGMQIVAFAPSLDELAMVGS